MPKVGAPSFFPSDVAAIGEAGDANDAAAAAEAWSAHDAEKSIVKKESCVISWT
jgi:hypothetical protein